MPRVKNLRQLREAKLLTQIELAERASVARSTVARLEAEGGPAEFKTIRALAKALDIEPQDLLGE